MDLAEATAFVAALGGSDAEWEAYVASQYRDLPEPAREHARFEATQTRDLIRLNRMRAGKPKRVGEQWTAAETAILERQWIARYGPLPEQPAQAELLGEDDDADHA